MAEVDNNFNVRGARVIEADIKLMDDATRDPIRIYLQLTNAITKARLTVRMTFAEFNTLWVTMSKRRAESLGSLTMRYIVERWDTRSLEPRWERVTFDTYHDTLEEAQVRCTRVHPELKTRIVEETIIQRLLDSKGDPV